MKEALKQLVGDFKLKIKPIFVPGDKKHFLTFKDELETRESFKKCQEEYKKRKSEITLREFIHEKIESKELPPYFQLYFRMLCVDLRNEQLNDEVRKEEFLNRYMQFVYSNALGGSGKERKEQAIKLLEKVDLEKIKDVLR